MTHRRGPTRGRRLTVGLVAAAAGVGWLVAPAGAGASQIPAVSAPVGELAGPARPPAPRPDRPATLSVTVQLAAADPAAVGELAGSTGLPPATRLARLRSLLPPARARVAVTGYLRAAGLTVVADTPFSVTAVGGTRRVLAVFGSARAAGGRRRGLTLPPGLRRLATGVVGGDDTAPLLHPMFTATPIDGPVARTVYDTPSGPPAAGSRQTIATVQFSGWDPADFTAFAAADGYPDPVADGQYTPVSVDGASPTAPDGAGGELEVALDQETLLDTDPFAQQRVYFAPNDSQGFLDAVDQIATDALHGDDIVAATVSWGDCEADYGPATLNALDAAFANLLAAGVTVFAASGDQGAYACNAPGAPSHTLAVQYPASDPNVVGVGGTSLDAVSPQNPTEQAWSGSGGGVSGYFPRPAWQAAAAPSASGRAVPDIALDADPSSGVWVRCDGGWQLVGGTSLSSPLAAATFTDLLGQAGYSSGIGDIHRGLYAAPAGAFRDITVGGNGRWTAGPGYDLVTGRGAPRWDRLSASLIGAPVLRVPAYTPSRRIPVTVTTPPGMAFNGWVAGVGNPPGSCPPSAGASPPSQVPAGADGPTTVWVGGYTSDGRCHVGTAQTVVDTVPPVAAASAARVGATAATFRWSATDPAPGSGVAGYTVRVTDSGGAVDWTATTTASAVTLPVAAGLTYTVQVTAKDRAGNTSAPATATVDVPAGTVSVVAVTGTNHLVYRLVGSSWVSLAAPPGGAIGGPAVVSSAGRSYFFVVCPDHDVYVRTPTTGWARYGPTGTWCTDRPGVTAVDGAVVLACAGRGQLGYTSRASLPATGLPATARFTGIGGQLAAGPAVAVVGGRLTWAGTGPTGTVYLTDGNGHWSATGWRCAGAPALQPAAGGAAVFGCTGGDGTLYTAAADAAGVWSAVSALTGRTVVAGPGVAPLTAGPDCYVTLADGGLAEHGPAGRWLPLPGAAVDGVAAAAG